METESALELAAARRKAKMEGEIRIDLFGWDLLYKTIDRIIEKKTDLVVALAHFVLLMFYDMQCVGLGEDTTFPNDEDIRSDLLPPRWNESTKRYALRYVRNEQLYILTGHIDVDVITLSVLDVNTARHSELTLSPGSIIKQLRGTTFEIVPDLPSVVLQYRKKLVDPLFPGAPKEVGTQTLRGPGFRLQLNPCQTPAIGGLKRRCWSKPRDPPPPPPDLSKNPLYYEGHGSFGNLFPMPSNTELEGINPCAETYKPKKTPLKEDPDPDKPKPQNSDHGVK